MEAVVYFGLQTELKWQHEAAIVRQKMWSIHREDPVL